MQISNEKCTQFSKLPMYVYIPIIKLSMNWNKWRLFALNTIMKPLSEKLDWIECLLRTFKQESLQNYYMNDYFYKWFTDLQPFLLVTFQHFSLVTLAIPVISKYISKYVSLIWNFVQWMGWLHYDLFIQ